MYVICSFKKYFFLLNCALINDEFTFLMKWCVGKTVYNANLASDAENAKYNWLFNALLVSSIFLNIQLHCDRRTRNFAKLTVL